MSRSYRKNVWVKDGQDGGSHHRAAKREASQKVRRVPVNEEIPNGGTYKKFYCSWNICDYKWLIEFPVRDDPPGFKFLPNRIVTLEEKLRRYHKARRK